MFNNTYWYLSIVIPVISLITNGSGIEGQTATVTFEVDANPQIVADNVSVSVNSPAIQIIGDNVTLTFSNLVRSNDGEHTVTVSNSEGSDTENFTLSVYCKWNNLQLLIISFIDRPIFARANGSETVAVGHSITLDCSIQESNPPPNILAYGSNSIYGNNILFDFTANTITISNAVPGNSGVYTCSATNTVGTTTLTYTLNVEG